MEIWQIILIIVGGVLILGLLGYLSFCLYISNMMANMMIYPKHFKTTEEKKASNASYGDIGDTSKYQRTPINFVMSDGYVIHGDYSLNNPKKFVICMHGHRGNREGLQKYSWALYRLGYSLVFYDHRSHGDENKREKVTMSYQEHKDALEIIEQVKEKFGQDIELGLFGNSMGAATALSCTKERQDLSFVVADSAFAGVNYLIEAFIKIHKSPKFPILQFTEMFIKHKAGFAYKDASIKDIVKENKNVPILLIHGDKDEMVFPKNAEILFANIVAPKRLEWFKGATHCNAVVTDRNRYYKVIEEFIKENVK